MPVNTVISPINSNPTPYPDGQVAGERIKTLSAAGTTQATGTAIASNEADVIVVGNNDANNGSVLPANCAGKKLVIVGALNAVAKVYPPVGGSINYGSANAAVSLAARKPGLFVAVDALNWICLTDTTA